MIEEASNYPSISIVIPTYNSEEVIKECLRSIRKQEYPKEKIEVIVVDAGSSDETVNICKEYEVDKILENCLKTGEAGKSIGIKAASNEILALIDSDNILDRDDWFKRMVEPFTDEEIVGVEHLQYVYRRQDPFITRYCALTANPDPLSLFLGNYPFYSTLTGKWTEIPVRQEDKGNYIKIILGDRQMPAIGANGFLVRRNEILKCSYQPYYFDIDIVYELIKRGNNKFAKVKVGIVHLYCQSVRTFIRKQKRRIKDYIYYKELGIRQYPWSNISKQKYVKFTVYTVLVLPLISQSLIGYIKKPDTAWFFHPLACWITLWVYSVGVIQALFKTGIQDRSRWEG